MRIRALCLLPLLMTACDVSSSSDDAAGLAQLQAALPDSDRMSIRMPSEAFLVEDQATFYGFTRGITQNVNGFVRNISNLIEDITDLPPSSTDDATFAVWGPYTDPLSPATWRVRVDRTGGHAFTYRVEGWPKDQDEAAARTVLEGRHEESADGVAGQGTGGWTYDMTAGNALDPASHQSVGEVEVSYTITDTRVLEVRFTDVVSPGNPLATSSLYRYTEAADRSGTFDFISNLDIHAENDPQHLQARRELLQVRSRWQADGPGRADVVATHGDLPAGQRVDVIECWDRGFTRTYVRFGWSGGTQEDGDVGLCPYPTGEAPTFEGFDPDSFADGDLIAAIPAPVDFAIDPGPVAHPSDHPAVYYKLARGLIAGLGGPVRQVLGFVTELTRNPPSDCEPDRCTWGPWTDWNARTTSKVTIVRLGEGQFTFTFQAKHFGEDDAQLVTVLEGGFARGAAEGDGSSWFVMDFDAQASINPDQHPSAGRLRSELERTGGEGRLAVRADGIVDENGGPSDARYVLATHADGTGSLDLRLPANVDDQDPARRAIELVEARVRWQADGSGVAAARATGGDLGAASEVLFVECWDDTAAETHRDFAIQRRGAEPRPRIDPAACVFDDWQDADFPPMSDEQ